MGASQQTMNDDLSKLRMAYVLFMDIVGYSLLPMDRQREALRSLQEAVSESPEFVAAKVRQQIIKIPTGDGMALVFFDDVEAAARCAIEVCKTVRLAQIPLRMGLHYGPVYVVSDINEKLNVTGGGINIAQRIMDCGDAGHILASQSVADTLSNLSTWSRYLHGLGEIKVKHHLSVYIHNFYIENVGNAQLPMKVKVAREIATKRARRKFMVLVALTIVFVGLVCFGVWFKMRYFPREESDAAVRMQPKPVFDWVGEDWGTVLHKGMRREEVRRLFGPPNFIWTNNGVETWSYGPGTIQFSCEPPCEYVTVHSWRSPVDELMRNDAQQHSAEKLKKQQ